MCVLRKPLLLLLLLLLQRPHPWQYAVAPWLILASSHVVDPWTNDVWSATYYRAVASAKNDSPGWQNKSPCWSWKMVTYRLNCSTPVTSCYFIYTHAGGSWAIRPISSHATVMFPPPPILVQVPGWRKHRQIRFVLFSAHGNKWAACQWGSGGRAEKFKESLKIKVVGWKLASLIFN